MTVRTLRPLCEYDAVLVDLDGTLVDSEGAVRRAWGAFAQRHGLDAETVLSAAQGRPSRETARELAPDFPDEPGRLEHDETADTDGVVALPGAGTLLDAGFRLAIVTSCSRALAIARLTAAGLPRPEQLISSDDISHGKPDPECYLLGARRLGADPAQTVVLEDAPAGIAAGRAAGMTVIGFTTTHTADEVRAAGADVVLAGPAELTLS